MHKNNTKHKRALSSDLEVDDLVRVVSSNRSQRFATGYTFQNSEEIFRISKIKYSTSGVDSYEIEDWGGDKIEGIFYRDELIPTSAPKTFPIEILKKRRRKDGTVQYYIHWNSTHNGLMNG